MRKLKTSDIFAFSRCLKAIGVKDEIQEIANKANTVKEVSELGIDLLYRLFDIATEKKAEKEIYKFLSGPFEMSAEQIESMDLDEFFGLIKELASINTWLTFFKQAVPLTR